MVWWIEYLSKKIISFSFFSPFFPFVQILKIHVYVIWGMCVCIYVKVIDWKWKYYWPFLDQKKCFRDFFSHDSKFLTYFCDIVVRSLLLALKVVPAAFLLVCFLSLNKNICETRKNIFYFTSKDLFVLEKIKFSNFTFSYFMTSSSA